MVDLSVKLDAFEGPISLLYHLIEKNEIDIYDIPIASLADQYIEIVQALPPDMESLSLFLVMAATLLEIKSKMLLPSKKKDEDEELDPREELIRRLLEYKKFKEISEILKDKGLGLGTAIYKGADKSAEDILGPKEAELDKLLDGIGADSLFNAFVDLLNRKELKIDKIRSTFSTVKREEYTIEEKITHLKSVLKFRKKLNFSDFFPEEADKTEIIVTFLALLELIKQKEVAVKQSEAFNEIVIEAIV